MLGTNPLAIGVPTAGEPFVLDMATSLISMGQTHDRA
jgi:L-2-hydroxycarboxylate dehydrogenase (NAD+)